MSTKTIRRMLTKQDWFYLAYMLPPLFFILGWWASSTFTPPTSWIEPTLLLASAFIALFALYQAIRTAKTNRTLEILRKLEELLQEVYKTNDDELFERRFIESLNLRYLLIIDQLCQGMLDDIYDDELIQSRFGYLIELRIISNVKLIESIRKNANTLLQNEALTSNNLPLDSIRIWTSIHRKNIHAKIKW